MGNLVAIVGRPNVGKSTLFNRLTQSRRAIVNEKAGTTRDRQYGKCEWNGQEISIIDTGGWVVNSNDIFEDEIKRHVNVAMEEADFEDEIKRHVNIAMEEADIILFVVDVQNGITDLDEQVAQILRCTKKPVVLVSNKTDTFDLQYQSAEFYGLGLGDPYIVSAINGLGTGELLDHLFTLFENEQEEQLEEELPRFAMNSWKKSCHVLPLLDVRMWENHLF